MRPKIMLVDDDIDFISEANNFIFDADIITFLDAGEALEKVSVLRPDIIITDVMMPGIHGFRFISIAKDILKALNLVVISANSKEQIEREFGQLGKIPFFRKPLAEDFHGFIDKKIDEVKSNKNVAVSNMDIDEDKDATFQLAIDQINRLAEIYKRYHDLMYKMAVEKKGFYAETKYGDAEFEALEKKLSASLIVLVGNSPEKQNQVLSNLDREYKSWQTRVLENKEKFIVPISVKFEEPIIMGQHGIYNVCGVKDPVYSYSVDWDKNGDPEFEINGSQIPKSKTYDIYGNKAGNIVYISILLDILSTGTLKSRMRHIWAFWYNKNGFSGSYSISGFTQEFMGKSFDSFRLNQDLTLIGFFYLKDARLIEISGVSPPPIPQKSVISGKISLDLEYKNKEISAFHERKKIHIPVDDIIADSLSRGFKPDTGPNARVEWAMGFIYEVVLKGKPFKYE